MFSIETLQNILYRVNLSYTYTRVRQDGPPHALGQACDGGVRGGGHAPHAALHGQQRRGVRQRVQVPLLQTLLVSIIFFF